MVLPTRVAVLGSNSFSGSHFVEHVLAHTDAEVLGISVRTLYSRLQEYGASEAPRP